MWRIYFLQILKSLNLAQTNIFKSQFKTKTKKNSILRKLFDVHILKVYNSLWHFSLFEKNNSFNVTQCIFLNYPIHNCA